MRRLLANGWIVTMDDAGTEHESGWVLVDGSVVSAVGRGTPPEADEVVDLAGAVVTPGLVNTHHHLFQTLTRARAQEADLFTWLRELYPVWARLDDEAEYAALVPVSPSSRCPGARPSSTTTTSSRAARAGSWRRRCARRGEIGVRIVASRGSMDLGESAGGLPPDSVVEDADSVLAATEELAGRLHEPGAGAMVQIAVAPCSPFSVSKQLMADSAALARRLGLQLHTHLAETVEEDAYCRELYGCTPVEYLTELGWTASDVWCAHCVHLSPADVQTFAAAGVGVAHCPTSNLRLGAGVAPVRELVDAGVRVGLGVDGSASNERSDLFFDVKQALLVARGRGGPGAMTCREALWLAHARRRGRARARRHRLDRARQVCGSRRLAHGRPRAGRRRRSRRRTRPLRPASRRPAARRRRGRRPRRPARQGRRGRDRPRAPRSGKPLAP